MCYDHYEYCVQRKISMSIKERLESYTPIDKGGIYRETFNF